MRCPPALVRRAVRTVARLAAVVLTALLPAAPPAAAQPGAPGRDTRPTVAVLYFNNGAILRHAEFEPLSKGVADMLITDLARNKSVRVIERDQLQRVLDEIKLDATAHVDRETAVRVGKLLGVHHMVFGGFVIDLKGRMRLVARAIKVETGETEHVESAERKADDVLELIDDLGRKMNDGMRLPPMPDRSDASDGVERKIPDAPVLAPDTGARQGRDKPVDVPNSKLGNKFQALMLYSRALSEEDNGRRSQAVALYRSALVQYPGYAAARVRLNRLMRPS